MRQFMIDQNDASEAARDVLHRLALKARGMSGADVERLVRDAPEGTTRNQTARIRRHL